MEIGQPECSRNFLTSLYEAVTRYSHKYSISLFSCTSKPNATCRIETLEVITVLIMLLIKTTTLRFLWNFGDIIDSINSKDEKHRSDISTIKRYFIKSWVIIFDHWDFLNFAGNFMCNPFDVFLFIKVTLYQCFKRRRCFLVCA